MPTQLRSAPPTADERRGRDTRRWSVVAAVLGVLLLYVCSFTQALSRAGLPRPQDIVESCGIHLEEVWGDERTVDSLITLSGNPWTEDDRVLLGLFAILGGAFLSAYFLPLRHKLPSMVGWFVLGLWTLYGPEAASGLVAMHLAVYLSFHPESRQRDLAGFGFGALLAFFLLARSGMAAPRLVLAALSWGVASVVLFRYLTPPLLARPRIAAAWRVLVVQCPALAVVGAACVQGLGGGVWLLPLGLLLFFFQWERLMVYRQDFAENLVPRDLPLTDYLVVFFSPALLANWSFVPYVGQGYGYLASRYLCEDKNRTVLAGARLLLVAFFYLVLGRWAVWVSVSTAASLLHIPVLRYVVDLVAAHHRGARFTTGTVLLSTLFDQIRVFLLLGAITHFRVGVWRLLGYKVDTQYDRFWQATNLVSLWGRWAYHYREFLVRCFYYPCFFRFFKKNLLLRVFVATMVATAVGNHLWGHVPEVLLLEHATWPRLVLLLRRWPYFLLLGLGISLTQAYLIRKGRTRRPWTRDRWLPVDVLCAYLTFQFFALIHIFARPRPDMPLWDLAKLFLRGFGLHLD